MSPVADDDDTKRLRSNDPELKKLRVRPVCGDFEKFISALSQNETVKTIVLCRDFSEKFTEPEKQLVVDAIVSRSTTEELHLSNPCNSCLTAVQLCPNLIDLTVRCNSTSERGSEKVTGMLQLLSASLEGKTSLRHFNLTLSRRPNSFDTLYKALSTCRHLESVHIDHYILVNYDDPDFGGPALVNLLKQPSLRKISGRLFGAQALFLAQALQTGSKIRDAVVEFERWSSPEGAIAIAHSLKQNKDLQALEFRRIRLDFDFFKALAEALLINSTLTKLDLEEMWEYSIEGVKAIASMMKTNLTLTDVRLNKRFEQRYPHVEDAAVAEIRMYAELNRAGRGALLSSVNATQKDWVDAVVFVKTNVDALLYLLQQNPALCQIRNSESDQDVGTPLQPPSKRARCD